MSASFLAAAPDVQTVPSTAVLHRFSAEDYERLIALGFLTPEDRVELLDGFLLDKMSEGLPHAHAIRKLNVHFVLRAAGRWAIQSQTAVRLDGPSLPEPDVALLQPPENAYAHRRPAPADILLLIEVAESSLLIDRGDKLRAYARAAVPEYWIVNLPERRVEVHRDPEPAAARYRQLLTRVPGDTLAPAAFADAALPVAELFG